MTLKHCESGGDATPLGLRLSPTQIVRPILHRVFGAMTVAHLESSFFGDAFPGVQCSPLPGPDWIGSPKSPHSRLATGNPRRRCSALSATGSRHVSVPFTHSACVIVRPKRASTCTWSSIPPMRMGGQSSVLEIPPRYACKASRVTGSRRNGRRSFVEKTRCM